MAEPKKTNVDVDATKADRAKPSSTGRGRARESARGPKGSAASITKTAEKESASPEAGRNASVRKDSVVSKSASASKAQSKATQAKQAASGDKAAKEESTSARKASTTTAKAKPKARSSARTNATSAERRASASKASSRTGKPVAAGTATKSADVRKARMSVGAPLQVGRGSATVAAAAVKPVAAERKSAPVEARNEPQPPKKFVDTRHGFKLHEYVVYPSHGVGQIVGIEDQEIAGMALELFVITFEKDKMTLRVPTSKLQTVGMRKLAQGEILHKALDTLKGRARIKRTMWSRRAQEYEAKINSGDIVSIAEVVRDLYRSDSQPEQSYSERQLFEAALDRMARELAAVENMDERGANQRIIEILSKSAKSRKAAAEEQALRDEEDNDDGDSEAAAA